MGVYLRVISELPWPAGYAGVDGLIAAISQDLDEVTAAPALTVALSSADGWRTLYAAGDDTNSSKSGFSAIGYDPAVLGSEDYVYSLIVHYLLNNRPAGTDGFELNEHLLLQSRDDALRLIVEWESWQPANPGDKETLGPDDAVSPLAVYLLEEAS